MKIRTTITSGAIIVFLFLSPFASAEMLPDDPAGGGRLFASKGCVKCHALKGEGGKLGPDLGRTDLGDTPLELAALIWNHTPAMIEGMERAGIPKPALTGNEFTAITDYLYFLRFFDQPGDPAAGRYLFDQKGCLSCHPVSGKGSEGERGLDEFPRNLSPVFLSQAIWNHSPGMMARMVKVGRRWPTFQGTEMMDLLEFIRTKAKGSEEVAFFRPGNPKEGKRLFEAKGCLHCHSVEGEGPGGRIDLGRRAKAFYTSLTQIASSMWNKAPDMILVSIAQTECGIPNFTSKEMSDILAYLYFLHYVDGPGDASNGKKLFTEMGCAQCHGRGDERGRPMFIDLSKYRNAARTEIVASIWNHGVQMRKATGEQGISWPQFKKGDMADLLEFLRNPPAK